MSRYFTFKLSIVLLLIALPVAGYFAWQALGGTVVNLTLTTNPDLEAGLVGHWTFDGKDMVENARDRSGQGNTGYLTNFTSTTTRPGKLGQGLDFDGSDDYIKLDSSASLNIREDLTISAWIKLNSDYTNIQNIIYRATDAGSRVTYWFDFGRTDNKLAFFQDITQIDSTGTISDNDWHHVVVTRSGTTGDWTITFYIDAVSSVHTTAVNIKNDQGVMFVRIGAFDFEESANSQNFNGLIDDVRIYNRALSSAEIKRLYELGATTKINTTLTTNPDLEAGLVGHWTFDGKDMVENARDRSGQGNTGYLTNFTSTTTRPGKIGQGLDFDGSDDYVDTGNFSFNDAKFSASAWIKIDAVNDTFTQIVGSWDGAGTDTAWGVGYYWNDACPVDDRSIYFQLYAGSGSVNKVFVTPADSFNLNQWHHVVAVRTGAISTRIYVDGVSKSLTSCYDGTNPDVSPSTDETKIGARKSTAGRVDGTLDDARIYNRALSSAEIKRLYELGATTKINTTLTTNPDLEAGLVGHWTFDGKDMVENARDRSGQGNTGYLTNFTSTTTRPGKIGQGLEFDGVDDYVEVLDDPTLKPSLPITVTAWVKWGGGTRNVVFVNDSGIDGSVYSGVSLEMRDLDNNINVAMGNGAGTASSNRKNWFFEGDAISGQWTFLTAVFSGFGDNDVSLYVDGASKTVDTISGTASSLGYTSNSGGIGASDTPGTPDWFFNGLIDDVRIYDRALSPAEIKRLYELGSYAR